MTKDMLRSKIRYRIRKLRRLIKRGYHGSVYSYGQAYISGNDIVRMEAQVEILKELLNEKA